MFTQRETILHKAIPTAGMVLLLLTAAVQSAVMSNDVQITAAPPVSNSSPTTQIVNSSEEEPHVESLVKMSCGETYKEFCGNGGQCMFPPGYDEPICLCKPPYTGPRCMIETILHKAIPTAGMVLLLLTTAVQSAVLSNDVQTTAAPPVSNSSLTTHIVNSSVEEPRVWRLVKMSCGETYKEFCGNGGQCMFPQDSDKPSCICKPPYSGPRCMVFTDLTRTVPNLDKVIGISFGAIMLITLVTIIAYCCAYKRCVKSAPLIKSAPSETSV
ncbi:epigen-like [Melanotaenia boesemani]|uniref:epigen-like n=1 Tax=Melanotaenia boesemani TaxID=1250792 RepID=UPI001C057EB1|nr:epigen-like [Melanotaenia boesemani]